MIHARECVAVITDLLHHSTSGFKKQPPPRPRSESHQFDDKLICHKIYPHCADLSADPSTPHTRPPSLLLSELHHSLRSCCHLAEHCRLNRPPSKLVHAADKLLVFRYPLIKNQSTQADSAALFFFWLGGRSQKQVRLCTLTHSLESHDTSLLWSLNGFMVPLYCTDCIFIRLSG